MLFDPTMFKEMQNIMHVFYEWRCWDSIKCIKEISRLICASYINILFFNGQGVDYMYLHVFYYYDIEFLIIEF